MPEEIKPEPALQATPPENEVPHISPYFFKGMELGDLMFSIAAVYAYDNIGNRRMAMEVSDYTLYEANVLNQYTSVQENESFASTFRYRR